MKKIFKLSVIILLILACISCVACSKSNIDKKAEAIMIDGFSYDNGFLYEENSYYVMENDEFSEVEMNSFSGTYQLAANNYSVKFNWAEFDGEIYISTKGYNNKNVALHTVKGNKTIVLCELLDGKKTIGFAQCFLKDNYMRGVLNGELLKYTITDFKYTGNLKKAVFVTENNIVYVYDGEQEIKLNVDFGDNEIRIDTVENKAAVISYVNDGEEYVYVYNFETGEFKDPEIGANALYNSEYVTYAQDGNIVFKNTLEDNEYKTEIKAENVSEIITVDEGRFCVFCNDGKVLLVDNISESITIVGDYEANTFSSGIYKIISKDGSNCFALLSDKNKTTVLKFN